MIPGPSQCVKGSSVAPASTWFQSLPHELQYVMDVAIKKKKSSNIIGNRHVNFFFIFPLYRKGLFLCNIQLSENSCSLFTSLLLFLGIGTNIVLGHSVRLTRYELRPNCKS